MFIKFKTYYEDGDGNPAPAVPPTSPPPPPPPPAPGNKTFTQSEVDKLMADHRKGLQDQNRQLVSQLEEIRNTANLTVQQKEELEARITTLSQQHLTKEQQTAAELDKLKKKYDSDTKVLTEGANVWKSRFENQIATTQILAAADKHKAAKASQLVTMLGGRTKVVEVLDEAGKQTGIFAAQLTVQKIDPKTKQPIAVDVSIDEAIALMREDPEHGNLFLVDGKPGFGGNNVNNPANGTPLDWSKMTPEEFRKRRKEGSIK